MRISDWSSDVCSSDLRDGEAWMPFGTPGGDGQDQWTVIFFLRHVHHGMNLQAAIDAPTWQTAHFPSSFFPRQASPGKVVVEGRLPAATVEELRRRGHRVEVGGDWSQGRLSARSEEHTSELQSLMSITYAVLCFKDT